MNLTFRRINLLLCLLLIQRHFIDIDCQGPPSGSAVSSNFRCPSPYGYYPNPYDCASYYYCWNSNSYLQYCPEGLQFWARNSSCSVPEIAQCRIDGTTSNPNSQFTDPGIVIFFLEIRLVTNIHLTSIVSGNNKNPIGQWPYPGKPYPGQSGLIGGQTSLPSWLGSGYNQCPSSNECCRIQLSLIRSLCTAKKNLLRYSFNKVGMIQNMFTSLTNRLIVSR